MFGLLRASNFPISLQKNKRLILIDGYFTLECSGNYSQNSVLSPWMFKRVMRRTPPNPSYLLILLSILKIPEASKFSAFCGLGFKVKFED